METQVSDRERVARFFEWVLGAIGAIDCVAIVTIFALSQPAFPGESLASSLWPFPAIYFLEISLVGLATLAVVASNSQLQPSRWSGLSWISAGILLTFVIMGGFSIGPYLFPGMLAFLITGILSDWRQHGNWPTHFMAFLLAAMVQAVLVFLAILVFR